MAAPTRAAVGATEATDDALARRRYASMARRDLKPIDASIADGDWRAALAGVQQVLAAYPESGDAWRRLARISQELGRDAEMIRAARRALAHGVAEAPTLALLLHVLLERRKIGAASRVGARAAALFGQSKYLDGLLCELAYEQRDLATCFDRLARAEAIHGPASRTDRVRRHAEALRDELAAAAAAPYPRHIAIAGVSHVGSTLLGVLLGSVPGMKFAGETHGLTEIKAKRTGTGSRELISDSDRPIADWPEACRVCGTDCAVFTPEARLALAARPVGRYATIAQMLDTPTLVTSDKNLELYLERDPLFRFDMIVLYKPPADQIRSHLKNYMRKRDITLDAATGLIANDLDTLLSRWATNYLGILSAIRPQGRRVVVNWPALVARPEAHWQRLSSLLAIDIPSDIAAHVRLGHFTGGNSGIDVATIASQGAIALRPSNAPDLPPELAARIAGHPRARLAHALLDRAYRHDFAGIDA